MKKRKSPFKKQHMPILTFVTNNEESITNQQKSSRQVEDKEEIIVIEGTLLSNCGRDLNRISSIFKGREGIDVEMSNSRKRDHSVVNSQPNGETTELQKRNNSKENCHDLIDEEISKKRQKFSDLSTDDNAKECEDISDNSKLNLRTALPGLTNCNIVPKKQITGQQISFYPPQDTSPNSYSIVIREHVDNYFTTLAKTQSLLPPVDWGDAILPGRHYKDTIQLLKPGQRNVNMCKINRSPSPVPGEESEIENNSKSASKNNESLSSSSSSSSQLQVTLISEVEDNDKNDGGSETEVESVGEKKFFSGLKQKLMLLRTPSGVRNVDKSGTLKDGLSENSSDGVVNKQDKPRLGFYKSSETSSATALRSGKDPWKMIELDIPSKKMADSKQVPVNLTPCPICNKKFAKNKIESHASTCGTSDEETDEPLPDLSVSKSTYQCSKCGQQILIARRTRHLGECSGVVDDDDDDFEKLKKTPSYNIKPSTSTGKRLSNNMSTY